MPYVPKVQISLGRPLPPPSVLFAQPDRHGGDRSPETVAGNRPLVTVIIPSYNHAGFVSQAIRSVAEQTYRNIELIIIDDGSSDDSVAVIEGFLREAGSLNARLYTQDNCGAHNAINLGMSMAEGDYLAILDSDDFYYPDRMKKLVMWTQQYGCDFVFTKTDHVSSSGAYLDRNHPIRNGYLSAYERRMNYPYLGFSLLQYNLAVTTSNFFMKKSLGKKIGPFHDYKLVHDWDYLLRVLLETEPCFLDEPLLAYRIHENNTLARLRHLAWKELNAMFSDYAGAMDAGRVRNRLAPPVSLIPPLAGPGSAYRPVPGCARRRKRV